MNLRAPLHALLLATFAGKPWHVYLTLGLLVGAGTTFTGYTGQALFLPNWFVRRRGLAMGIAFSGVGFGSIVMLPALQTFVERHGWRAGCLVLGLVALVVLVPLNLLLRRRPEELGLSPDGDVLYYAETYTGRVFRRSIEHAGVLTRLVPRGPRLALMLHEAPEPHANSATPHERSAVMVCSPLRYSSLE